MVRTTCPFCGAGCGLKVFLKNGRALEVFGDEENPLNKGALCPRGLGALFHLYHPARLRRPLLRHKLSENFREVSWKAALDYVAERLKEIGRKYCPESLYLRLTPGAGLGHQVLGRWFGELYGTPHIEEDLSPEASAAGIVLRRMLGLRANGCAMSPRHEWSSCQAMLLAGVDPAVTDPISFGPILDARDRGARLIAVHSRKTVTMDKADTPLKCRAGTEQAVLLSMAHVILKEDLLHREFVKRWVEGLEEFSNLCQGYPPSEAERISGVRQEEIIQAARVLARNFPSQVIGPSPGSGGSGSAGLLYALVALTAITGTIGCPGGGLTLFPNFPPLRWPANEEPPSPRNRVGAGSSIWKALAEGRPYALRAAVWDGNPLALAPGGLKVRQALKKMDLIVHLAQYPNLTYHHAHVVFPMASFLETEGLVFMSVGRNLQWANQAVQPGGECRPADDFWGGLLRRSVFISDCSFIDEDGRVSIREMTRRVLASSPFTAAITPELLDPEANPPGGIQWPAGNKEEADFPSDRAGARGTERLFRPDAALPGEKERFPTPSGKVNISPACLAGEEGFREFLKIPDRRRSLGRTDEGHDFILLTGELADGLPETGFWGLPQKPTIPLYVQIHPQRAKALGVSNGDPVVVENERGRIQAPAWVTDRVDEESIFCAAGADPHDPSLPYESPMGLMDFAPHDEQSGRRFPEAVRVKVRRSR